MINELPNAAPIKDKASLVYFLHIPKTGGTTLNRFLTSQFGDKNVCPAHLWHKLIELPPKHIARYSLIWGHFYSYLYRYVPVSMRYLTFLRDPVERALSHYGHIMSLEGHYLHRRAQELGNFSSYLRDAEMSTTLTNFQVRALACDHDPLAIAQTLSNQELSNLQLERRLVTAFPSKDDGYLLEVAKHRLTQMCFVGITERHDDSVALLCKKFGWKFPTQLESHNVNSARIKQNQLDQVDLELLRKMNEADYALYEFACQLFTADFERFRLAQSGWDNS